MHKLTVFRCIALLLVLAALIGPSIPATAAPRDMPASLNVQQFLEQQPGVLKHYSDGQYSAAQAIETYTSYYSLDPRIILTLLELVPHLLTEPNPSADVLSQPFGWAGSAGFSQQIEWAVHDIKAGFGPYAEPPAVQFADGTSTTLNPAADPSIVAVQLFLAQGRTEAEWRQLSEAYEPLYNQLWNREPALPSPAPVLVRPFLQLPWPAGTSVVHTSYFDHTFPTVDLDLSKVGERLDMFKQGKGFALDYLGRRSQAYPTHDGHDYYFPDKPIGTPILAAASGIAYAFSTYGNGVIVQHGGEHTEYETTYWHLDRFAAIFDGKVDTGVGVYVDAGTEVGTSGKSGYADGPHLHFEVRRNGKLVDPYGWYGSDADPCIEWSGCETSVWLWHGSLLGSYDFTPPDGVITAATTTSQATAQVTAPLDEPDPVSGSIAVAPESDLLFLAPFDDTIVPAFGYGLPAVHSAEGSHPRFTEGRFDRGVLVPGDVELNYPIDGNLLPERGTIALWAKPPAKYPESPTKRHYLWTASANPDAGQPYSDTLALRRELTDDGAQWNFWSVDAEGVQHNLVVSDTLEAEAWHHVAVAWDKRVGGKALFIDGELITQTTGISLPATLGERFQVGRFTSGFGASEAVVDDLAVWSRVLSAHEIERLATGHDLYTHVPGPIKPAQAVTERTIILDTNAVARDGEGVSVQLRRDDGPWTEPMPYYDSYRWTITGTDGLHTFSARFLDRSGNESVVTTTLELLPPLTASAEMVANTDTDTLFKFRLGEEQAVAQPGDAEVNWLAPAIKADMQISEQPDFAGAFWEPYAEHRVWRWKPEQPKRVYVRFRDDRGRVSTPILAGPHAPEQ